MRTKLHQFFRPTKDKTKALLTGALISYDTNVLLNLYRYSEETRNGLVKVLRTFAGRTRLPHQVALEYARNRASTIIDQVLLCEKAEQGFQRVKNEFILPKNKQPFLSAKSAGALDDVVNELAAKRKELEAMISEDPYADLLMDLFDEKIGAAPDQVTLQQLHEQAGMRYKNKTPPGYADINSKGVPEAYGDYIVWRQLMDVAKDEKQDFIFITDETKEDWRLTHGGRTIGYRPELIEEFNRETGRHIWIVSSEGFLIATKEAGSAEVADSVIQELADYRVAQTSILTSEDKVSRPAEDGEEPNVSALALKSITVGTEKKGASSSEDDGEIE